MRYNFRILVILTCCLLVYGCNGEKKQIKTNLETMTSIPIQLSLGKMQARRNPLTKMGKEYKMVVYVDSSKCTPCALSHLRFWNPFIKKANKNKWDVEFIFILAPKEQEMPDIDLELEVTDLPASIYIDTAFVFNKKNSIIPQEDKYHTFLLDRDNRIILVGDPINNDKIKEIIEHKLNKKVKK